MMWAWAKRGSSFVKKLICPEILLTAPERDDRIVAAARPPHQAV